MKPIPASWCAVAVSLAVSCTEPNPAAYPCGPLRCVDHGTTSTGTTAGPPEGDAGEGRDDTVGVEGNSSTGSSTLHGTSPAGSATEGDASRGGPEDDATRGDSSGDEPTGDAEGLPICGDGLRGDGEGCDDGEQNGSYGHCDAECGGLGPHCGDGELVQAHEECDDGNDVWNDGCDPDCVRSGVVDVESGRWHNCVILRSDDVKCWGHGDFGKLGYGAPHNIGDDETPASVGTVPLGGPVDQLALGREHSCALLMDGSVKCWGSNAQGQLGYGNDQGSETDNSIGDEEGELARQGFVTVDGGRAVVQLSAGDYHTCAVLEDGALKCWGDNSSGQLGLGDREERPTQVPSAFDDVIATGVEEVQGGYAHTCARSNSSLLRCWGSNRTGQLGNGDSGSETYVLSPPVGGILAGNMSDLISVDRLATGASHTCAARGVSAWCWGHGAAGQLGHRSPEQSTLPVPVAALSAATSPIEQLVAGADHNCSRHNDGELRCWGNNLAGQLGDGQSGSDASVGDGAKESAVLVSVHTDPSVTVFDVSAGSLHTCALLSTGAVRCWGSNTFGRLGTGTGEPRNPGPPENIPDIELFSTR